MNTYTTDIVILGGGIAGLWLLSQLKKQNYNVLLLEANALGAGQTILSQGIIHGGTKYAIKQQLSPLARHIKTMPKRWQDCLNGTGEINLSDVKIVSHHQHLWIPEQLGGKFVGFLTSKVMQSRVKKLTHIDYPPVFQHPLFQGEVYSLNEPVLDIYSLLSVLQKQNKDSIVKINSETLQLQFNEKKLEKIKSDQFEINARYFIFMTGEHNEQLAQQCHIQNIKMQKRPLHMLLLKSLPFPLYAHCVDHHFKPRLTITSYPTQEGYAWYFGGEIAEKGALMDPDAVYHAGKKELTTLFPWLNLDSLKWKTIFVNRAEPWQSNGKIPPAPFFTQDQNTLFAWPVKLAYAPLLAQEIISSIKKTNDITPKNEPIKNHDLPPVNVAIPPWQEETGWN